MRLARLELSDFRCFKAADIDLSAPVTFICGANASGKSSCADAIEWALNSSCRGTDLRGAGSKNLIRDGAEGTNVRVAFDDGSYQTRMLSRGGTVKADPPAFGLDKDIVKALVSGQSFLDLAHADAKRLLMGVLNVHVDIDGKALTLDQVEAKYQVAFEARRNAKAALNAITIPVKPEGEVPNVEAIDAKLADLRKQEHDFVAKAAKTSGKREQLDRDVIKARNAVDAATRAIAAARIPADLDVQLAAVLNQQHVDDAPKSLLDEPAPVDLGALKAKVTQLNSNITYISGHTPGASCVLSPEIPCRTAAAEFQSQVKALTAEMKAVKKSIAEAELRQNVAAEKARAGQERAAFKKTLQDLDERRQTLTRQVVAAEAELARVTAERDATPEDAGPSPELLTLRQRISSGEHISHEAREIIRQRIAHEDATKAQAAAAEKLQKLEKDVSRLGPKGLRVKALADSLGAFETKINEALDAFGYVLKVQPDPWSVLVNGRSSELLSTSERMRVGLAFSVALASVVGSKWVILDGADILDDGGKAGLGAIIETWTDQGGQIIVTATRPEPLKSDDGKICYWLEDGTATKS